MERQGRSPTGEQYEITSGEHRAVVTELGSALRVYSVGGRDVLLGFGVDEVIKGGRGQELIPWPNRIRDGRYEFAGVSQQLPLTEPARHNASHGLARQVAWTVVDRGPDFLTQGLTIFPQPGWPGLLRAELTFHVGDDGLTISVRATNLGDAALPFGYGAHPYLTVGEERVDEIELTVPAERYLVTDERLLPARVDPVGGTEYDFRDGNTIGERTLDTAFTDLHRDDDGRWRVRLQRADRFAELWAGPGFAWTQVFTGEAKRDIGVAVEPMSCGPDAFNPGPTHDDLRVLEPGAEFTGEWGIVGG